MIPITIHSCDCSYWAVMIVVSVEIVKNVRIFILVFQRYIIPEKSYCSENSRAYSVTYLFLMQV
jgi:hypothetical protein